SFSRDWSSDVCSSDLPGINAHMADPVGITARGEENQVSLLELAFGNMGAHLRLLSRTAGQVDPVLLKHPLDEGGTIEIVRLIRRCSVFVRGYHVLLAGFDNLVCNGGSIG